MAPIRMSPRETITAYRDGLQAVLDALPVDAVQDMIHALEDARKRERQIFIVGNGGSAATASHMACDLAKTALGGQMGPVPKRFRTIALTDNVPLLTAYGNDVSYDAIFSEPLRNLANPGDLLIVITASGRSPNILQAVQVGRGLGLVTLGLLGFDGGPVRALLDHAVVIEHDNYGYIEDAHMVLTHLVTHYFKQCALDPHYTGGMAVAVAQA